MSWTLGGTNTGLTVSCWLVWQWKFSQISADHVELDLDWVEDLTTVNADNVSDHLWHDNTVSQVSLDNGWFLTWLTVLLGFFALIVKSIVSVLDLSCESSSLSGSEKLDNLFSGESVNLFRSITSEWIFLKTLLFLLNCGHINKLIYFNNRNLLISFEIL